MAIKGKIYQRIDRQPAYATADDAIRGRRVWLSGGTRGLGLRFGKDLLGHGCAALAIADIADPEAGAAAVEELKRSRKNGSKQEIKFFRVDVRNSRDLSNSMLEAGIAFGGLDTVINNAGVADERELDLTIAVNLVAVIRGTEAALEAFEEVGGDAEDRVIVNVASAGAVFEMPIAPIYSASKHGVLGYTKSMRNACWERGVRINCYCPGWADIGMGQTVSKVGKTAKFTGIMTGEMVADGLVELFRRRDLVGEAVYITRMTGARVVAQDISKKLEKARFAKL